MEEKKRFSMASLLCFALGLVMANVVLIFLIKYPAPKIPQFIRDLIVLFSMGSFQFVTNIRRGWEEHYLMTTNKGARREFVRIKKEPRRKKILAGIAWTPVFWIIAVMILKP